MLLLMLLLNKKNMKDSLDMCPRRHRELLWRHKGDWKRPESNSNGPTQPSREILLKFKLSTKHFKCLDKNEQPRKCQKTLRKTF